MRYSPEEIFKKFINSVLSDASLDFFVKRAAVFLSMMMPVSSVFLFRSVEGAIAKLAECGKTSAFNVNDHFSISQESMTRLRTEKHFFSEGACNLKIFTGHETCAYADVHRSVYKTDTSAVYIPLKFNMLRETSVTMVVLSMGVDNYTQEHLDICSLLTSRPQRASRSRTASGTRTMRNHFRHSTRSPSIISSRRSTAPTAKSPDRTALPNSSASIRVPSGRRSANTAST